VFKALADGGEVQMPLAETFFSPSFGMVADRFGVPWMVVTMMANEAAKERQAEVSI
jgi:PhnB protein